MIRAVLAWLLLAGAAAAQDIAVQAGEHPGFTRLAVLIGAEADWRLGRTDGGYGLRLETQQDFATGEVFDTVGRDRIAALVQGPGRLDLAVTCACHARAFLHRDAWLVIDIADGPPPTGSPWEEAVDPPSVPRGASAAAIPLFVGEPLPFPVLPGTFPAQAPDAAPASGPDPRAVDLGRDMSAAIAAAADRGLLDLAVTLPGDSPPPPAEASSAPPARPLVTAGPPGIPGIVAHDATDRGDSPETATRCPGPEEFDVAAWAGSGNFPHEIGLGWAALTDGRDRILSDRAEDLARRYIAFGFGREALQVLALDPADSALRDRLATLAHIVDDEPVGAGVFARAADCPGPITLWQVLAEGTVAAQSEVARTHAIAALNLLPIPLRGQLAPRLAAAFAAGGDPLAAEELLQRHVESPGLAAVDAALAARDPDAALGHLQEMAATDPHLPAESLVTLVDLALEDGQQVDAQTRGLVEAARFELRGQDAETGLLQAEIRALTAAGDYAAALDRVPGLPDAAQTAARAAVVMDLAQSPDSAGFIETVFAAELGDLTPGAGNALADRLIAEGFPDVALGFLAPTASGPDQAERRYLRASAAAALGRRDLVEAELLGLSDPRAQAIRAGLDPGAAPLLAEWRNADWTTLAGAEDALLAAAAAARLTEATGAVEGAPLAARSALLSESEAARQLARDLLARFGPP